MNKAGLVNEVVGEVGLTKRDVGRVINAITKVISGTLSNGDKVTLVGFGTFQVMQRRVRRGRNPQTGEEIQIPAKKVPKFVPGKSLREKVGREGNKVN